MGMFQIMGLSTACLLLHAARGSNKTQRSSNSTAARLYRNAHQRFIHQSKTLWVECIHILPLKCIGFIKRPVWSHHLHVICVLAGTLLLVAYVFQGGLAKQLEEIH